MIYHKKFKASTIKYYSHFFNKNTLQIRQFEDLRLYVKLKKNDDTSLYNFIYTECE